jgi:phospholipase C
VRDAAAPGVGAVLTLSAPRTDDPLQGVTVPQAKGAHPADTKPSHLQQIHADLVAKLPVPDGHGGTHHQMPVLHTNAEYHAYIKERTAAWKASRKKTN